MTTRKFPHLVFLLCSAVAAVTAISAMQAAPVESLPTRTISVAGHPFRVEVAVSATEKSRGLMYRSSLPDGQGMVFGYDPPRPVSFWMKNVRFSLDLLFFDRDGCLLGHYDRVPPCTASPCPLYPFQKPTSWVLELPAGTRERLAVEPGHCTADLKR